MGSGERRARLKSVLVFATCIHENHVALLEEMVIGSIVDGERV
jgi:hypothetical protein